MLWLHRPRLRPSAQPLSWPVRPLFRCVLKTASPAGQAAPKALGPCLPLVPSRSTGGPGRPGNQHKNPCCFGCALPTWNFLILSCARRPVPRRANPSEQGKSLALVAFFLFVGVFPLSSSSLSFLLLFLGPTGFPLSAHSATFLNFGACIGSLKCPSDPCCIGSHRQPR